MKKTLTNQGSAVHEDTIPVLRSLRVWIHLSLPFTHSTGSGVFTAQKNMSCEYFAKWSTQPGSKYSSTDILLSINCPVVCQCPVTRDSRLIVQQCRGRLTAFSRSSSNRMQMVIGPDGCGWQSQNLRNIFCWFCTSLAPANFPSIVKAGNSSH